MFLLLGLYLLFFRFFFFFHFIFCIFFFFFFFSSRRRHTRWNCDWSSDVCSSDLLLDYVASGRIEPKTLQSLFSGLAKACRENSCSLVGGETAEMPGMYPEDRKSVV